MKCETLQRTALTAFLAALLIAPVGCGGGAAAVEADLSMVGGTVDMATAPAPDLATQPAADMAMAPGKDCVCGQPGCGACPAVKMIPVEKLYEIDATEVTIAAYAEFLAANVTTAGQPKVCAFNKSYAPACTDGSPLPGKGYEKHPVTCVDWCDAAAYCKWAGKHLCRGEMDPPNLIDEWWSACEGLGGMPSTYPYGDVYSAQICNTKGNAAGKGQTWEAGANGCESSHYPGLFDMSGNVAEWGACRGDPDVPFCPWRGGSYQADASTAACLPGAETPFANPSFATPELGFRCCK